MVGRLGRRRRRGRLGRLRVAWVGVGVALWLCGVPTSTRATDTGARFGIGRHTDRTVYTGSEITGPTYYVATTGSDSRTCSQAATMGTPKRTINNAVGCLTPGDTLYVRGGDYAESLENPSMSSGTSWDSKVRIAAYPGELVWLRPVSPNFGILFDVDQSYIEIDGLNVDARTAVLNTVVIQFHNPYPNQPHHIRIQNAELLINPVNASSWGPSGVEVGAKTPVVVGGIELRYLTIHGGGRVGNTNPDNGYGIYLAGPNNLVEYNNIYDNKGCEIQAFNDDGALPDNNIIRNNIIHDETRKGQGPASCGIIVAGSNNQIYNNIIYNIRASATSGDGDAIALYRGDGNKIWNNTFYSNTGGLQIFSGASNTVVQNNISYANTGGQYANAGSGTQEDHNVFGANPLFVNPGGANFQIQSGSPAKNAGVCLGTVTVDITGVSRPQQGGCDMGAYELP